ncbi:coiled-coil domain-containing protein 78 [Oncorhynchus nerka]|uniref:coiled-coil domain-containing protein 78 n=1 Tax=Oncorhynchus nerka TaxID=8023 RepID=UPI00113015FE|nr:coiled-coil domain-containing protein 78 [Oncorhynchus nerka]
MATTNVVDTRNFLLTLELGIIHLFGIRNMDVRDNRSSLNELQDKIRCLTDENVQLRDKNESHFTKLGYLESRLGYLAGSKTDLSSKLVSSEEEKLKISKELVEVHIQTNKVREQYEKDIFDLKIKILSQEGVVVEMEMERDRLCRELQSVTARLQVAERTGSDLTEEYMTLKRNYLALTEAHDKEVVQNDELSAELLGLAQARDDLFRQTEEQQQRVRASTEGGVYGQTAQELDRVRALVSRMSHNRIMPEDLAMLDQERKSMEKSLLGNQDVIKDMLEQMKKSYEEQQHRLEEKVVAMGKEQQENKRAIRDTQQKRAEQSAAMLSSQSQLKEVEEENSKLQMQVKELNEEYRARLGCYLQDLAEYVDGLAEGREVKGPPERVKLRGFVDSMLQEVRSSYRAREEQLASAARSYKKRLQRLTKSHQALLSAYRVQREQVLSQPESGLDPGPPEAHFSLEPSELRGETERELQLLRQDKARLAGQLREAQKPVAVVTRPIQTVNFQDSGKSGQISEEAWTDIRKQLREITNSTQEGHERERAQLITRATVAEEQLLELQEYVDKHLGRYKQEITRLRRLLGLETGLAHRAEAPKPRQSIARSRIQAMKYDLPPP